MAYKTSIRLGTSTLINIRGGNKVGEGSQKQSKWSEKVHFLNPNHKTINYKVVHERRLDLCMTLAFFFISVAYMNQVGWYYGMTLNWISYWLSIPTFFFVLQLFHDIILGRQIVSLRFCGGLVSQPLQVLSGSRRWPLQTLHSLLSLS